MKKNGRDPARMVPWDSSCPATLQGMGTGMETGTGSSYWAPLN